jgi:hypothetical protein
MQVFALLFELGTILLLRNRRGVFEALGSGGEILSIDQRLPCATSWVVE